MKKIAKWYTAHVIRTDPVRIKSYFGRFEPYTNYIYPLVAQLVEHPTLNRQVVGSNPTGRTKIRN